MAKDAETGDLFEADGVTPKAKESAITPELLAAEKRAAAAEGEAKGLEKALKAAPKTEKPAPKAEKVWTCAELRAQVNDGTITEDQMDEMLDHQREKKFAKLVDEKVTAKVAAAQTGNKVSDQITAYVDVFPDINKAGSALRAKVEKEYQELVANESPETLATELAAIKIACGPLRTGAGRKPAPDAHQDVGEGGGSDNGRPETDGWAKGLSPKMKTHYEKLIGRGMYKSHSDPRLVAELKLVRGRPN